MHEVTLDLDAQPGIATKPITRSMVIAAAKALGLDARDILNLTISSNAVRVTALLSTTDGARVLGHRGPHGEGNGHLKHTYTVRVVDDEEAMTPSEYYKHKADEDYATYKRVREDIIARYGDEEAYLKHDG